LDVVRDRVRGGVTLGAAQTELARQDADVDVTDVRGQSDRKLDDDVLGVHVDETRLPGRSAVAGAVRGDRGRVRVALRSAGAQLLGEDVRVDVADVGRDADRHLSRDVLDVDVDEALLLGLGLGGAGRSERHGTGGYERRQARASSREHSCSSLTA
jgi:hypothetical protein